MSNNKFKGVILMANKAERKVIHRKEEWICGMQAVKIKLQKIQFQ